MRIAITGGIADGKSTVARMLSELGHATIDADAVVRSLLSQGEVIERIAVNLGQRFVQDGRVDRQALREEIAAHPTARRSLGAILHPQVITELLSQTDTQSVAFAEVPLLIETATQGLFDEVWVCVAGIAEQRRRLSERLGSGEAAAAMLATQLPTSAKIPFADRVVRTNQPLETVRLTVARHEAELVGK